MAALLPHKHLTITETQAGSVQVDGLSSQGAINRGKILELTLKDKGKVIKAEDLMTLNKDESRALFRDHDVVYVYHNRIDAIGDKLATEEQVFEAAEDALQEIIRLIKKLTAANATNLLITSDHGFLYQNRPIEESDFASCEAEGDEILCQTRRYVIGKGLKETPGLRKFTSAELGLAGQVEVLIPKSINRLRLKGSGSRFVHGGATLQEVIIPVVEIKKKRQSDTSVVEVEILGGSSSTITAGQLAVTFYQAQAVTDKIKPRSLRAGIYTRDGELISNSHDLTFDITSDNPRDREQQVRFLLTSKADTANNQHVTLRLDEKLTGTSHYQEYKSAQYLMRRSFTSDFDF
jgi:uncharacterized protein (TIGR02687 family)